MDRQFNKIFGIGLSKTGTTSLATALRKLGFRTADFPCDARTRSELEKGQFRLSILTTHDALTDTPAAAFFAQYDQTYPDSKFILTVRDKESWLRSVESHWAFTQEWEEHYLYSDFDRMKYFIRAATYGCISFDAERYSAIYEQHEHLVRRHFASRPENLLVMDVCAGEGYDVLCPFLGMSAPGDQFPRANSQEGRSAHRDWLEHMVGMAGDLEKVVPLGQSISLFEDYAFAGSRLAETWPIVPFGDTAAVGEVPINERDADYRLQSVLDRGTHYFVVPWSAFWWRDHYPALFATLDETMQRLLATEHVWIYAATQPRLTLRYAADRMLKPV